MVIDTGLFIDFLRSSTKINTTYYKLPANTEYFISTVTLFELYVGATSVDKEKEVFKLTNSLTILPFTKEVAIKAAEIHRKLKKENQLIEFRDIFIAATCLVNNQPLTTLNTKHFSRIKELKLV